MPYDLRGFVHRLRMAGEVVHVPDEVSPVHQVAALLEAAGLDSGPAVLATRLAGYPGCELIGNLMGTRRRLAMALDTGADALDAEFRRRRAARMPPRLVSDGPVRAQVVDRNPNLLEHLPVLTHYEDDAGPYITAGVLVAREPGGPRLGMGIHRLQVKGPSRLGVLLAHPPLSEFLRAAEAAGRPLEVAVAVGTEPAVTLAAVTRVGPGEEKLDVAGGLLGCPLELVRGVTVDVPAPANAEFVIEGRVLPGVREEEGPFGESTGCYLGYSNPVIEVTGLTRREQPLYQAILPWGAEVDLLIDLTMGRTVLERVRDLCSCVTELRMSLGTCGMQVVLQVRPCRREEVRRALALTLSVDTMVKVAIAVNQDIDPGNAREVNWAVATRMQPDRDLVVLSDLEGFVIDPTAQGGITAKLGIDATLPPQELQRWRRIQVPEAARNWARAVYDDRSRATTAGREEPPAPGAGGSQPQGR